MKKKITYLVLVFSLFSVPSLIGCDENNAWEDDGKISYESSLSDSASEFVVSNYTIPENFQMTLQISDTSIFNKGDPWYFKTAKIGNDWQFIYYDRDAEDLSVQETHFYQYISDFEYKHYIYSHTEQMWIAQEENSTSTDMMMDNGSNFSFLYKKPTGVQYEIKETEITYDTDPTSIDNSIPALLYEYTLYLDYEVIVDANNLDLCLSENTRDGATITTSWKAYRYSDSITDWNTFYMSYLGFQSSPV